MLVKFDHIAYTCRKDEIEQIRKQYIGYTEVFREIGVPNLAIKKRTAERTERMESVERR